MEKGHITIEEFQKCEVLRGRGYTVTVYTFMEDFLFPHPYGVKTKIPRKRIIAYKGEMQYISEKFAKEHLLEDVFDKFVENGE